MAFSRNLKTSAALSLQFIRVDLRFYGLVVSAFGIRKLLGLRYLDISSYHLHQGDALPAGTEVAKIDDPRPVHIPNHHCEPQDLVPPNWEVLKITSDPCALPELLTILYDKGNVVPHLKKVLLSCPIRDVVVEQRASSAYGNGVFDIVRDKTQPLQEAEIANPGITSQTPLEDRNSSIFRAACGAAGVDFKRTRESTVTYHWQMMPHSEYSFMLFRICHAT
jgi:hypothetical protein